MAYGDSVKNPSSTRITMGQYLNDIQNGGPVYGGVSTGAANLYTLNFTEAPGGFQAGQRYYFLAHQSNAGACSVRYASTTVSLKDYTGVNALPAGVIQNGDLVEIFYDGTQARLIGVSALNQRLAAAEAVLAKTEVFAGTSGGAANVQTGTVSTPTPTLTDGLIVKGYWGFTNTTVGLTYNLNGLGALSVKIKDGTTDPGIAAAFLGEPFILQYQSSTGTWLFLNYVAPALIGTWTVGLTTGAMAAVQTTFCGATGGNGLGLNFPAPVRLTHLSCQIAFGGSFSIPVSIIPYRNGTSLGAGATLTLTASTDRLHTAFSSAFSFIANQFMDIRVTHAGGAAATQTLFINAWGR